jgi:hypothetical protein
MRLAAVIADDAGDPSALDLAELWLHPVLSGVPLPQPQIKPDAKGGWLQMG